MRTSHHAPGSAAAQAALASLAGWTPSRRGFLSSLLITAAGTAATAAGAAIVVPAAAAVPDSVSTRMAELIADFIRLNADLDAVDPVADEMAWDRAAVARRPALEALVFQRPESLIDLAAKMTALSQFMQDEDTENFVFRRLAEDATLLAGGVK